MTSEDSYFVHSSSFVDNHCSIGGGTKIWHFCHIMGDTTIGTNCNLGQNVVVSPGCRIGSNVKIQNNVSIYSGVTLEDDVFCGPSAVFTNVINPRSHLPRRDEYQETMVLRGATIGANATIVCGITLGRYCFVGAGAVVTKDVQDFALLYGNPARLHGWMCYCGERLPLKADLSVGMKAQCETCERGYEGTEVGIRMIAGGES